MTEPSSSPTETQRRHIFAWILFPLALFPLVALLTYDWHAIRALNTPPAHSSNWIGALGDGFAYYGYLCFGLAIWIVPFVCVIAALCLIHGRKMHPGRRELWFLTFLASLSCLLQVVGTHSNGITTIAHRLNLANAGGALGYLIMTRMLSPLVSDFGSAILMVILIAISLVAAIGAHNLAAAIKVVCEWALTGHGHYAAGIPGANRNVDGLDGANPASDPALAAYQAALAAKEAAKAQREAEKAAAREAKLRLKEEKRAAKEAAKAAKEAERAAREAEDAAQRNAKKRQDTGSLFDYKPPAPAARPSAPAETKAADQEAAPEDKGPYLLPPLALLNPLQRSAADHGDVDEMSAKLIDTLKLFGVDATPAYTIQGPVVTKYAIKLAPGIRYSAVTNISDNLMGALHAKSLRIEAPIPGEECVGIEVPNRAPAGISFREIFESPAWKNFKGELPLLFGKDAAGKELVADLATMPHMLVAGATGQGKSVCLNSIINGLLMTKTPEQLKLIMVDPKSVEFTSYAAIPHLIVPVITENRKAATSLVWAVSEMEKRLKLFARARVRNIYDYNHRLNFTQTDMFGDNQENASNMPKTVPYIVVIIDEVADLMSQCAKEVVPHISRLTAKARAAGIHLILATQRPDAKVITGTIKANIPGRVAFKTATAIDSRTILDDGGAENLIGRGDMLFKSKEGLLIRAQGAWISDDEIARVTAFIEQHANTQFDEKFKKNLDRIKDQEIDPFAELNEADNAAAAKENAAAAREQVKADAAASDFQKAIECIINTKRASTSHFQRQMGWGYNHAAKILDMLEAKGVVSSQSGMGPRQIIMDPEQLLALCRGGENAGEPEPGAEPGAENEPDALPNDTLSPNQEETP